MKFWLVQRLAPSLGGSNRTGFDKVFDLEYMGSAEYEFRTPYESLQRMRALNLIVFHHELHSCKGVPLEEPKPVFFIGEKNGLLDKITDFEAWLQNPRTKESTYFPENLTGLDWAGKPADDFYTRTVAWWSFTDDFAWTLDADVARKLYYAFKGEEVPDVDAEAVAAE